VSYAARHLRETIEIITRLDQGSIEQLITLLVATRDAGGRVFFVGVGGSAANCSHAAADFRRLGGFEAYAATDNVSELTASINDNGWAQSLASFLESSRLRAGDLVCAFSVGGGDIEHNVSPNIVAALQFAKSVGAKIAAIVGRDGGYAATVANVCVIVPTVNPANVTPHAEALQSVIWHLVVSDPRVRKTTPKWESLSDS